MIVTKNSSGNHIGFPSSFWGVLSQIIWNVPVSRVTDNPLWICNSQTLGRATSQRAEGCFIKFLLWFYTQWLSLDLVPSQDFRFPLWHNLVHSSIRGWYELSRSWDSPSERQKPPEGLPAYRLTSSSQHKTIVHTGAYSGSAVVEQCISLVCNKGSVLGSEEQRLCKWRLDTPRRRWVNCFHSDGEGVWPENKLGEVLGLLTKDNGSSQKQVTGFLLAIWFFNSETSKLLSLQKRPFKRPSPENSKFELILMFCPNALVGGPHLPDQCVPSPACLVLLGVQYWNTWKPVLHSLVEDMQTAGKVVLVQWDTYKLNPSRLHLMEQ